MDRKKLTKMHLHIYRYLKLKFYIIHIRDCWLSTYSLLSPDPSFYPLLSNAVTRGPKYNISQTFFANWLPVRFC